MIYMPVNDLRRRHRQVVSLATTTLGRRTTFVALRMMTSPLLVPLLVRLVKIRTQISGL